jgi:alkylation response protein AidB-like acyl-CoA dehydrogenase
MQYGTEEQKRRFIPDILDSKVSWCTGYSEPNHGSDLASIQCKAVRDGDHYVVNGQKIWTSGAPWADWIILLVRTNWDATQKHKGITCLLVPMTTPGVEVRPIENMAGDRHFAEVFFTDVRVPLENRLGAEGEGWMVTVSALANERSSIGEVTQMFDKLDTLRDLVRRSRRQGRPASEDPQVRRTLATFETRIAAMKYNGLRYLTRQLKGEPLSSETSVNKLLRASLEIEMDDFAVALAGQAGLAMPGADTAVDGGRWAKSSLSWPSVVIGGGTPNIQRNIIAERILGQPKD